MQRNLWRAVGLMARGLERSGTLALRAAEQLRAQRRALEKKRGPAVAAAVPVEVWARGLIEESRKGRTLAPGETTYVEDVIELFGGATGRGGPMFRPYVEYALTSIDRGRTLAKRAHTPDARRALDAGCAYGGVVFAMAELGVPECVGLELDERLLKLARKQARELGLEGRVQFSSADLLDPAAAARLGVFDVVTCIDVLEHVLDPEQAISVLASLAAPGGRLFVDIPNPTSHESILRDPHTRLFGCVLMSRTDAMRVTFDHLKTDRYSVGYYHPLEWYEEKLGRAGFDVVIEDTPPTDAAAVERTRDLHFHLEDEYLRLKTLEQWPRWRADLARAALDRGLAQLRAHERLRETDPLRYQLLYAPPVLHLRCTRRG